MNSGYLDRGPQAIIPSLLTARRSHPCVVKRPAWGTRYKQILLLTGMLVLFNGLFPNQVVSREHRAVQQSSRRAARQGSRRAVRQGSRRAIEIQDNQAWVQFPSEITFVLRISTSSPIDTIELEYGVVKTSCEQVSGRAVPEISETLQRRRVDATWTWELYRSGSMPPGARVWWRWYITTEDGKSRTTPRAWITFEDEYHEWQTLAEGQITVHWYEGDQAFGQQMLQAAVQAQARLTADPDANLEKPVHIYFYANSDDLKAALVSSQRWMGGIAFTEFYTVLIAASPQNQDYGLRTVAHELMHLVVHQLAFNCWSPMPCWLDEGLASWAEGDLEPSQQEMLDEAIAEDELLSLRNISSSFSAHSDRAHLSYAQSYSVVAFLISEYGRDKVLDLLAVFRDGATYDGALEQVYGFDTDELENLWRASVGAQLRPTSAAPGDDSSAPVPTLSLWSGEPTAPPPTATATPAPSPQPSATSPPAPTEAVVVVSPTARATRTASAAPQLIAGSNGQSNTSDWTRYAIAGLGGLVLLAALATLVYVRRN